jgi:subtilisin-like proprotein convertase family protein
VGEIWPHNSFIDLRYETISTSLYLLTSLGESAGQMSIGTFCHENGHLLCRFPDMYDYGDNEREGDAGDSAGIGAYCLMGSGNHLNFGRTPSPVCAYLRDLARWCDNEIILNTPAALDAQHGAYNTVMKFKTSRPNEYFIVENRAKLGLDQFLPSSGMAVYHCDTLGSNEFQAGTSQRHYQCALLQADGRNDLENNINPGDGGDLFSANSGVAISNLTTPSSRLWDGSDSGFVISAIEVPDARIGFHVGAAPAAPGTKLENSKAMAIPDNSPAGITSVIPVPEGGALKKLSINLDITHTYIGDLIVELTGPGGQKVALHNRAGASKDNIIGTFDAANTPGLSVFNGQIAKGNWTLLVKDVAGQDIGKLNRWSMEITTDAAPKSTRQEVTPKLKIPDNDPTGVSSAVTIDQPGTVGQMKLSVDITHTYIGDLRLELIAPSGRAVLLHAQLGGGQDNLVITYDSAAPLSPLIALIGQSMQGNWTLRVADLAAVDVGTLNKWSLELTPKT